jgi:predicted nucleic acid-binding protein
MDRIGVYPDLMRDLVAGFTEILLTEEVRDAAAHLPGGLRTLDAVHVASAQILGDSLDTLLTYDRRMLEVAQAAGLPAEAPGLV